MTGIFKEHKGNVENTSSRWVISSFLECSQMAGVFYLQVNALIARELSGFACTSSLTMNYRLTHSTSELSGFTCTSNECVNIIIQIEYTANKNRQTLIQPKPWCNDSGGYYTTIMTSRRLLRHNLESRDTNQPIRKSEFVQCMKVE